MRKSILLLPFLFQITFAMSQISVGVKGGAQINNTFTSPKKWTRETRPLTSYHFGIFTKLNITKKIAIIPELQFIRKGYTYDPKIYGYGDATVELNYVELPVILSYSPAKVFSLELGPTAGLKVSAKNSLYVNRIDDYYDESVEFGLTGGMRFSFLRKFSIVSRYYYGLSRISTTHVIDKNNYTEEFSEYNNNFQFSLYYAFIN
jgi:hypothetical protein